MTHLTKGRIQISVFNVDVWQPTECGALADYTQLTDRRDLATCTNCLHPPKKERAKQKKSGSKKASNRMEIPSFALNA